ncbi:MAG TPA: DUF1330 domain-containing protein [Polyangiales bacterium]
MIYALGQMNVLDPARYGQYVQRFMPILRQYGGRLLAAGAPEVVEGQSPYRRTVLLAFDDRASFEAWATSPAYEEIARDRRAATEGVVIVLEGLR